jgi:hypothetical protein
MRRVLFQVVLLLLLGVLLLGACQGSAETPPSPPSPENTPTPATNTPTPVAQTTSPLSASESPLSAAQSPLAVPEAIIDGKAWVSGRLFSLESGQPLNREVVRLAEVFCPEDVQAEEKSEECFWTLDNAFSPTAFTDETGYFVFKNVEPHDYTVMVGDYVGRYAFVNGENGKPIIFTAPADETTDVGEYQVEY